MMSRVGAIRIPSFSGERMRAAREGLNWSQGRLAAEMDIRVATISTWERGIRTPEPPTFLAIAQALKVKPADLLTIPVERWGLPELRVVSAGLHQGQVARMLGLHQIRIGNVELGYERPSDELTVALAKIYGTTAQEILEAWHNGRERLMEQ